MTISDDQKDAFRHHRALDKRGATTGNVTCHHAWYALERARTDVAAGKRRYPGPSKPYPAVSWQPGRESPLMA